MAKIFTCCSYCLPHFIYPEDLDRCCRCDAEGETLFHVFWDCPRIHIFWKGVQHLVHQVIGVEIPWSPLAYLLNVPPCKLGHKASHLLLHILTAAKCLIASFWKQKSSPSPSNVHSRIKEIRTLTHLTTVLNNRIGHFDSVWSLWDGYAIEHNL